MFVGLGAAGAVLAAGRLVYSDEWTIRNPDVGMRQVMDRITGTAV
ncbi:hypothetical protein ACFUAC_02720 [Streptomyces sp. NPDC057148]